MTINEAKEALDKVIKKARVHLYKPIQIAEILHEERINGSIDLLDLETYRTKSRKWRDIVCINFLGRTSTSSARYQDDIFNDNAVPPNAINALGEVNKATGGCVEKYIYDKFAERYSQMSTALSYCRDNNKDSFQLDKFLNLFWDEPGLRRSIDKIYEIIVFALFSTLVEKLEVTITVSYNEENVELLKEFEDFSNKVICINSEVSEFSSLAKINRVGVTNAADRGLDMWANFGTAIQIKHLSLNESLAEEIVSSVSSDRIVIVCKNSEEKTIVSLLNQIGWKSKIQSIVTETELIDWYERGLRGKYSDVIGDDLLKVLADEIVNEFPTSDNTEFLDFYKKRNYPDIEEFKVND
ncbi:HaeII family restriction endonuclease [Marinifilum fragile]|uniref:HaeII family restriction endonuclease n=1 Tax=Marinifilum fragile TaxID=570161 RepID=UPI002AA7AC17|nr:HaeII family restriction endonuclease [Marinifilum fragile]